MKHVHQDHGRVLRSNSAPEQCPCQVPAYFRMCVWALLAPPSRRRARISPPAKSHAIRLPGNKPAAWRIAAGMLVVPLLVNTVSFVFTVRIIPSPFLLVYPLWFSHNPFSPRFDCEVSLARTLCRLCRGIWAWNASSWCITDSGKDGAWRLHGFRRCRAAGPARFWGFPFPNG